MIYICKFIKIFNNNLILTFPEQSGDHGVRQQKPFGGDRQLSVAQGGVARVEPRARRVEQGFEPCRPEPSPDRLRIEPFGRAKRRHHGLVVAVAFGQALRFVAVAAGQVAPDVGDGPAPAFAVERMVPQGRFPDRGPPLQ